MSTQRFELAVEPRVTGKSTSRALRNQRRVPAVVYGSDKGNFNVSVDANTVLKFKTRAYENALFNIKSSDGKLNNTIVLMKDVTVHPLSRQPEHVDLFAIDLKKAVRVSIELKIEGKPAGLAEGGLLNVVNRTIEIECLPTEIPEGITVDVSPLGVGDALHVSDLKLPEGIKLISAADLTVAVVNLFVEEAAAPAADAAAAPAAGAATPAAGAAAPAAGAKDAKAAPAKDAKK